MNTAENKLPDEEKIRPFPKPDGLTRDEMQREIVRLHTKISSLENAIEHFYEYFRARLAGMEKHQFEVERMFDCRMDAAAPLNHEPAERLPAQEPGPDQGQGSDTPESRLEAEIGQDVQQMLIVSSFQRIANEVLIRIDGLEHKMMEGATPPAAAALPEIPLNSVEPPVAPKVQAEATPPASASPRRGPERGSAKWITNGTASRKIPIDEDIPKGWRQGRAGAFGRTTAATAPATITTIPTEEPMADIADKAQEAQEAFTADALAAHFNGRSRLDACVRPLPSKQVNCLDCGEPIHPERLRIVRNAVRCAACQRDYEG